MNITKYSHACVVLTKDNESLVVDPGGWSDDFTLPKEPVVGVIITHVHPDHFDIKQLGNITSAFPDAIIYAPQEVTNELADMSAQTVTPGETIRIGAFTVTFTGGNHAVIHESMPTNQNLGVVIDESFYYPGDSFTLPESDVDTLAIPASAPWMKLSEAMDFLVAVKPKEYFLTHDALLSDVGKNLTKTMLSQSAKRIGATEKEF